jgi:hypothetical protein
MTFEELLEQFLQLGGTAQNIVLREGSYGRGVFPQDPGKPILIHIPESLLIPVSMLTLNGTDLVVREDARIPENIRAFFASYQKYLSWGAGVHTHLLETERSWCQLPEAVKNMLIVIMQADLGSNPFDISNLTKLINRYHLTRSIGYASSTFGQDGYVMPFIELINHSKDGGTYKSHNGIAFDGIYTGEVFANYNPLFDSMKLFTQYRFCAPAMTAYSFPVRLICGDSFIQVLRNTADHQFIDGERYPNVVIADNGVQLSYLELGNCSNPRACRSSFLRIMRGTPIQNPNEVFDQLEAHNRNCLISLLRVLQKHQEPMISELQSAVLNQLETLSTYWGYEAR